MLDTHLIGYEENSKIHTATATWYGGCSIFFLFTRKENRIAHDFCLNDDSLRLQFIQNRVKVALRLLWYKITNIII